MKSESQEFYPSEESLQIIEDCAIVLSPEGSDLSEWHRSYVSNHKSRIALDLDIVRRKVPSSSSILEFGSIPLLLTTALSKCNYKVTGCDLAPERYFSTIKQTGINVVKCDIETEKLPFSDSLFDAAVFNELFEHLRINPIFTLSEVLRVLKPGGILMLSSPNLRSLGGVKNYLIENKASSCSTDMYTEYEKLQNLGHMGHVREYTTTEVIEFLRRIGFEVNGLIYRGRYNNSIARMIIRLIPGLRPFVSYIVTKPVA